MLNPAPCAWFSFFNEIQHKNLSSSLLSLLLKTIKSPNAECRLPPHSGVFLTPLSLLNYP